MLATNLRHSAESTNTMGPAGSLESRTARVAELPDGVLVRPNPDNDPMLLFSGNLLPWSFGGYGAPQPVSGNMTVHLLTPPSTAGVLAAGYRPMIHPSAL